MVGAPSQEIHTFTSYRDQLLESICVWGIVAIGTQGSLRKYSICIAEVYARSHDAALLASECQNNCWFPLTLV